jgi:hypothetical protein
MDRQHRDPVLSEGFLTSLRTIVESGAPPDAVEELIYQVAIAVEGEQTGESIQLRARELIEVMVGDLKRGRN